MKAKTRTSLFLLALVAMPVVAVTLFAVTKGFKSKGLKQVPDFVLTDSEGQTLSRADLLGKVWVANFVFTSCEGMCPILNRKMKKLQEVFGNDAHFRSVSISVDPETDDPETLRDYGKRYNADPNKWHFLTGERAAIKTLLQDGFKVVMSGMEDETTGMITHSNHFVVVDRQGNIRKYHDMDEDDSMRMVKRSVYKYLGKRF